VNRTASIVLYKEPTSWRSASTKLPILAGCSYTAGKFRQPTIVQNMWSEWSQNVQVASL